MSAWKMATDAAPDQATRGIAAATAPGRPSQPADDAHQRTQLAFAYDQASIIWNALTVAGFSAVMSGLAITAYPWLAERFGMAGALAVLGPAVGTVAAVALRTALHGCARPYFDLPRQTLTLHYLNPLHPDQTLEFAEITAIVWRHVAFYIYTTRRARPLLLSAIYVRDWQSLMHQFQCLFPERYRDRPE